MKIDRAEFTIFDVETTGLFPYYGDKICEIAAVRIGPSRKTAKKFSALVDPGKPISRGAFSINGITSEMVAGKPTIDEVLPGFMEFARDSVLVAYNAGFDMGFLESALAGDRDVLRDYLVIDALALARRFFPGSPRYNLGVLSRYLGIEPPAEHRALADACTTWKVFEKELDVIALEGIEDVEDIACPRREKGARKAKVEDAAREQKRLNVVCRRLVE